MPDYSEPYEAAAVLGMSYTSPTGKQFYPKFQTIPISRKRRHKVFEYIDVEGTYLQDMGMSSNTIGLSIYFIGPYHHEEAQAFEDALAEKGVAALSLPYDTVEGAPALRQVLPLEFKRTNQFVEEANRTVFEVEFGETIAPFLFTGEVVNVSNLIAAKDQAFTQSATDAFKNTFGTGDNRAKILKDISRYTENIKKFLNFSQYLQPVTNFLTGVQDVTQGLTNAFDTILADFENNVVNVFETPLVIGSQLQSVLRIPKIPQITNLMSSYEDLIESFKEVPARFDRDSQDFLQLQALFGTSSVAAYAVAVSEFEFESRDEALRAAVRVRATYESLRDYLDDQETASNILPLAQRFRVDPSVYESLYSLIQRITGQIGTLLPQLKQEAVIEISEDTTPLNICAKYYTSQFNTNPAATLSFFEKTNALSGDQLFLLESGTSFKVYI